MPTAVCQVCGAMPAAPVTVRGHQGMVVIMKFLKREGLFCRTCALASFRDMQADTLVLGWWGALSVFITPITLLSNLGALSGIKRMPDPVAPGWRPPLDPGKPVFRRPAGVLALIPLCLLGLVMVAFPVLALLGLAVGPSDRDDSGASTPRRDYPTLTAGSCARNDETWPAQDLKPEPCDAAAAQYRVYAPANGVCEAGDYVPYLMYSKDDATYLCLRPLKR
ncbi:hypothetical protein [Streptomyces sp. NPDC093591]|uniref:LppU/SCO3897 family protein n=1 Tax=Streptomyces sp. NPDC093591 TaxID=3366044 RepID=UPI0037FAA10A